MREKFNTEGHIQNVLSKQKYFNKSGLEVIPKDTNIKIKLHKTLPLHSFSGRKLRKIHILDARLLAKEHHGQYVLKFTTNTKQTKINKLTIKNWLQFRICIFLLNVCP